MRIRQVDLLGFKSFRDRTVLHFPPGITAIVGPNGCGKSNLVDGIRWVLGEQSVKHLRGETMEDVIFAGTERHPALGMAEVSLIVDLDDEDRAGDDGVPPQWKAASEIMVTRRLFRSGESEYLINKIPCRLRDITELFLGTGVGHKAYAVIEQGRVEQIVNAKPEELRLFIEEAAGTTRYRGRRIAAERKMERARENCQRLRDVIREIERQMATVRRLAARAEAFRAAQAELSAAELQLFAREHERFSREATEAETRMREAAARASDLEEAAADAVAERHRIEEEIARADVAERQQREEFERLRGEQRVLADRVDMLGQQRSEAEREHSRISAETRVLREQCDGTQARAVVLAEQASALEAERGQHEAGAAARASGRAQVEAALREAERAAEEIPGGLADIHGIAAQLESRCSALTEEIASVDRRCAEMVRLRVLSAGALTAAVVTAAAAAAESHAAADQISSCGDRVAALSAGATEAADRLHRWMDRLVGLRERLAERRAQLGAWEEFANSAGSPAAPDSQAVRAAAEGMEGVLGLLADAVDVPPRLEVAFAAALGERLHALIVGGEEDAVAVVGRLRGVAGRRVTCVPVQPRRLGDNGRHAVPHGTAPLLESMRVAEPFREVIEALLGDVLLVETLERALDVWRGGEGRLALVTPAGEMIDSLGVVSADGAAAAAGLSARPPQKGALEDGVAELERIVAAEESRRSALEAASRTAEEARSEAVAELEGATARARVGERQLERAQAEVRRIEDARALIEHEQANLERARQDAARELEELSRERAAAVRSRDEAQGRFTLAQEEVARRRAQLRAEEEAVRGFLVEESRCTAELARVSERRQAALGEAEMTRVHLERLEAICAAAREQTARLTREVGELAGARADVSERLSAFEESLTAAAATRETLRARVAAIEEREAAARAAADAARAERTEQEVKTTEARLALAHRCETMSERHGRSSEELLRDALPCDSPVEVLRDRVATLRDKLAGMGEGSAGALAELDELTERHRFLNDQRGDLERSLEDLRRTIQRLNRVSRQRFRETFAQVNASFQEVFPRLFLGGKAHLVLTSEADPLEAGVEMVVQPPGKRIGGLSLLSGGERALTAVSLLFALFLIRPSPFCILDEVDAPLDDANIGRFTDLVREASNRSQFIVITHNKRTMEAGSVLYGVTMDEPGVSRIVSARMTDAATVADARPAV